MTRFAVEFRGLLLDPHRLRLHEAGITAESSKADFRDDVMYSGQQFHTVTVEAESATEAVAVVGDALGTNVFQFTDWKASSV